MSWSDVNSYKECKEEEDVPVSGASVHIVSLSTEVITGNLKCVLVKGRLERVVVVCGYHEIIMCRTFLETSR